MVEPAKAKPSPIEEAEMMEINPVLVFSVARRKEVESSTSMESSGKVGSKIREI
jgi:hypothetical protein